MKITYLRSAVSTLIIGTGLSLVQFGSANAQTISFEELLANPGNVSMELRYAQQAERAQNYLSALSAYERVLLNYAENDEARLRYAELLSRLDDPQAARREIEILEKRELTADQSSRLIAIGGTPSSSGSGSGFFGEVSAGLRYDNNLGNALLDIPIATGADDFGATLGAAAAYVAPISDSLSMHFGGGGSTVRHQEYSFVDYDTYGGFAGLGLQVEDAGKISADIMLNYVNINNNRYQKQFGGRIKGVFDVSETVQWVGVGSYFKQDFENIIFMNFPLTFSEPLRNGDYIHVATGPRFKVGETTDIGLLLGYEEKGATLAGYAYNGWRLDANAKTQIGDKSYLGLEASYRDHSYDDNLREDSRIYGRLALGLSLDSIVDIEAFDLTLETGVSYLERDSNVFLKYDNFGLDSRIIARF